LPRFVVGFMVFWVNVPVGETATSDAADHGRSKTAESPRGSACRERDAAHLLGGEHAGSLLTGEVMNPE